MYSSTARYGAALRHYRPRGGRRVPHRVRVANLNCHPLTDTYPRPVLAGSWIPNTSLGKLNGATGQHAAAAPSRNRRGRWARRRVQLGGGCPRRARGCGLRSRRRRGRDSQGRSKSGPCLHRLRQVLAGPSTPPLCLTVTCTACTLLRSTTHCRCMIQ